jgi:peptide-methionine (S)-S-oxide reductase
MAKQEIATLGAGCFWCTEAVYREMEGVTAVEPGYMGGHTVNPTYKDVCTGTTGHVEVAQVTFDPGVTSYRDMLEAFFSIHDPTSRDRQGADVGSQYRSVIFYHSEEQRAAAEQAIRELDASGAYDKPVVTEVRPAGPFYAAENYHREYFANNPQAPYCMAVVAPKVRKFREKFARKLKTGG